MDLQNLQGSFSVVTFKRTLYCLRTNCSYVLIIRDTVIEM